MENYFKSYKDNVVRGKYYIFVYTALFLILAIVITYFINRYELSAIYNADAMVQHYPTQYYLNSFFYNLVRARESIFKEFNFNLGLGQDILSIYHYYGLNDPINLLLSFKKVYSQQKLYLLMMYVRMYLAGISFIILCNRFKYSRNVTIVGALIYVFSSYTLNIGFMHPYFINSMILLPLEILAVNILIEDGKFNYFIIMSFLCIAVNIYFSYMIFIFSFIYAIILIISKYNTRGLKNSFNTFVYGIKSILIAMLMSGYIVIPMTYMFFNSLRVNKIKIDYPLFIEKDFICHFFIKMFSVPDMTTPYQIGVSVTILLSIISLLMDKNLKLKVLILSLFMIVFVVKLQSIMNIFSYPTYRWIFGMTLLLAYIFVNQYDNICSFDKFKKIISILFLILFIYSYVLLSKNELKIILNLSKLNTIILVLPILFIILLILLLLHKNTDVKKILFMLLTVFTVFTNILLYSFMIGERHILVDNEKVISTANDSSLRQLSKKIKGTLDRVENDHSIQVNYSDIFDYPSTSVYYSIVNPNYSKFNLYFENSKAAPINDIANLNSRMILENILSVKYYYGTDNIPYGFYRTKIKDVYFNSNFIPFGFTYDKYINKNDLNNLDSLQKPKVIIKGMHTRRGN